MLEEILKEILKVLQAILAKQVVIENRLPTAPVQSTVEPQDIPQGEGAPAEDDDLLGGDAPAGPTEDEFKDAIRAAGAVNKDKAKAILAKYVGKGKEPRAPNVPAEKWAACIAELGKVKK